MAEDKSIQNYSEIIKKLGLLCQSGETGTFSIATSNNHHATISLKKGKIIGATFRPHTGREALERISQVSSGRCSFLPRTLRTKEIDASMPAADDISRLLKIEKIAPPSPSASEPMSLPIEPIKEVVQLEVTKYLGPIGSVVCQDHFKRAGKIATMEDLKTVIENIANQISDASGDTAKGSKFKNDVLSRI